MEGETIPLNDNNERIKGDVPVKEILHMKNAPFQWTISNPKTKKPKKKSRPSSKKPQPKRVKKNCELRIPGDIEFTTDGKTIVTPDITCSKIKNGRKLTNFGNVICNSCKRCFCCAYEIEGMRKCAMKRNCFEIHRKLDGSQCKNAGFTPLSKIIPTEK